QMRAPQEASGTKPRLASRMQPQRREQPQRHSARPYSNRRSATRRRPPYRGNLMTTISNTPYSALEVGQKASFEKTIGERDIQLFAAMSGDRNPVHLDAEFARGTLFKERIAHGML